jgi:hypothetical protein
MATLYIIGFALQQERPVKIGWSASDDATDRRAALQTGSPRELRLLRQWTHPQAQQIERALKQRLVDCRLKGEWYDISLSEVLKDVEYFIPRNDAADLPKIEVFRFPNGKFLFHREFCRTWHQHGPLWGIGDRAVPAKVLGRAATTLSVASPPSLG